MAAAPVRFLSAALWPVTIWMSLRNLEDHPADDYVERTSPIVATAVAFWVCVGVAVASYLAVGDRTVQDDDAATYAIRLVPQWASVASGVMWFFIPALYIIGLWLYTARDEAFPR